MERSPVCQYSQSVRAIACQIQIGRETSRGNGQICRECVANTLEGKDLFGRLLIFADIEKEKLVICWTNQVPHMGHVTTSAVESSHSSIKKYLVTSRGDLKSVFERLVLF